MNAQVTVYTRSKRVALKHAEERGIVAPIAVKVAGGFICYGAYTITTTKGKQS